MGYHLSVRYSISAAVALLGLLAFPLSGGSAQINGVPSSVTSPGFGGRPINGAPASVTSLGPRGYAPRSAGAFSPSHTHRSGEIRRHPRPYGEFTLPYFYAVPVPYAVGATDDDADPAADDNYQGGPTIFDRRGAGAASYVPPVRDASPAHSSDVAVGDPDPPQPPTVLVFKDGRKVEVGNYAIVGSTLFDLAPGHVRKVAIADLNLEATSQENDARGVTFQLPAPSQSN